MELVFVAIVAVVVVSLAVVSYRKNQARIRALQSLAMSKGWQYSANDPFNLPDRWPGDPFGNGFARSATNVITGHVGPYPMVAFDYRYKERSTNGKGQSSTHTYHYAVCALAMPCALPELHVAPESVFSRLGQALGMQDIELESEDFNRRYRVRCPDRKLATDVLTPRTMETLLRVGGFNVRFVGADALCAASGRLHAADLLNRTAAIQALVDGIPTFVWKDHGLAERPPVPSPRSML